MLTVIVTITGRFICRANSYCDNNDNNRATYVVELTVILTITGRSIGSVSSYCDNNANSGEVYMQFKQLL